MKRILNFNSIVKNLSLAMILTGLVSLVLLAILSIIPFILSKEINMLSTEIVQKFLLKNLGIILFLTGVWTIILSIVHPETLEKYKVIHTKK